MLILLSLTLSSLFLFLSFLNFYYFADSSLSLSLSPIFSLFLFPTFHNFYYFADSSLSLSLSLSLSPIFSLFPFPTFLISIFLLILLSRLFFPYYLSFLPLLISLIIRYFSLPCPSFYSYNLSLPGACNLHPLTSPAENIWYYLFWFLLAGWRK